LETLSTNGAAVEVWGPSANTSLTAEKVRAALERVGATRLDERTVELHGLFRGATLDSWRFDFHSDGAESISGNISDALDPIAVGGWNLLTNSRAVATIKEATLTARGAPPRVSYEILSLRPESEGTETEASAVPVLV